MADISNQENVALPFNVLSESVLEEMVGGKFEKKLYHKPAFSMKQLNSKSWGVLRSTWLRSLFLSDLLSADIYAILLIGFSAQGTYIFQFHSKGHPLNQDEWVGMFDCMRRPFTDVKTVTSNFMDFENLYNFLNKTISAHGVTVAVGSVATDKGIYGSGIQGINYSEIIYDYLNNQ